MQLRDDEQQPADAENTDADAQRRKALQDSLDSGGTQDTTDPPARDPDPAPAPAPAAPAAPAAGAAPFVSQWDPGSSAPSNAPPGQHWDASLANYVADAAPAATTGGGPPSGGALTDPNFAQQFVAYWGSQPGANPSVKGDPAYWVGRFTSGAFGNDQQYAIQRMMQAEGPPEGASQGAPATTGGQLQTQTSAGSGANTISAGSLPGSPTTNQFGDDIRRQLLALLNQAPVDQNDPDIAGAISANKVATERSLSQENDQIAEQAYAQRLGGAGSTQASLQAARERTGAGQGQFAGNLVAQQATARRSQITQLLQVGAGVMTADQQQQLQLELAKMDAILRQQSITNQNTQANDQLGYQYDTFQANMNRNSVLDAMGVHL